jgi:hypothetical protein
MTPNTSSSRKAVVVPDLRFLCSRAVSIHLFQVNIRWRLLSDVTRSLKQWLFSTRLPRQLKSAIHAGLGETFREVQRWGDKHCDMFLEDPKRLHRGEHLRMYFGCLVWKPATLAIDDFQTAERIMRDECADWPQMQFQFACAYAMVDYLEQNFDKVRLRAFKRRLNGHPLYDFWLDLLTDKSRWEKIFVTNGLAPSQMVSLVFQWAIINGYFEMVKFLWARVTDPQREYIGKNIFVTESLGKYLRLPQ